MLIFVQEFRPGNQSSSTSRPGINAPIPALDDDAFPWDYCIPAKSVSLEQVSNGEKAQS